MAIHIKENWIDSCVEELLLPGSPWYDVKEIISKYLVGRIRIEGLHDDQISKLRYFLGTEFLSKYTVQGLDKKVKVQNTIKPDLDDKEIEEISKDLLLKAVKDAKCEYKSNLENSPQSFKELVILATNIFESTLNTYLNATKQSNYKSLDNNSMLSKIRSLTDKETEVLGEAMVMLLQKEPGRLSKVLSRLSGRLLPMSLRAIIYRLVLLKIYKSKSTNHQKDDNFTAKHLKDNEIPSQQQLREDFANGIRERMNKGLGKKATNSDVENLIRTSVVQKFDSLPGLKPYSANIDIQKETSKVLNILYTYNNQFESFYIPWVVPLEIAIHKDRYASEHYYELAMWLSCLVRFCFPTGMKYVNKILLEMWNEILSDVRFQNILDHFSKLGIVCDTHIVQDILSSHNKQFMSRSSSTFGSNPDSGRSSFSNKYSITLEQQNFNHPILCIRTWLMNLFIGSTDVCVSMYLMDQIYCNEFDRDCFKKCCIMLLDLMKSRLLVLDNVEDISFALLERVVEINLWNVHSSWNKIVIKDSH